MKIFNEYFKLQEEIYNYFGYIEDWGVFPIEDRTKYYWKIDLVEDAREGKVIQSGFVYFAETKKLLDEEQYSDEIYHNWHLPKAVYEGKDYVMILVDTHTDGNKFLAIYDKRWN